MLRELLKLICFQFLSATDWIQKVANGAEYGKTKARLV